MPTTMRREARCLYNNCRELSVSAPVLEPFAQKNTIVSDEISEFRQSGVHYILTFDRYSAGLTGRYRSR